MFTDCVKKMTYLILPENFAVSDDIKGHFIKEKSQLFFICPSCGKRENCVSILRRSLFPLTALIHGHHDFKDIFENDIIHSWNCETFFGMLVFPSKNDEEFFSIGKILEEMNEANQIPFFPNMDYFEIKVKFIRSEKSNYDDHPLIVTTLDQDFFTSIIPIAQYAENDFRGLAYHCFKCKYDFWVRDGSFVRIGDHI